MPREREKMAEIFLRKRGINQTIFCVFVGVLRGRAGVSGERERKESERGWVEGGRVSSFPLDSRLQYRWN